MYKFTMPADKWDETAPDKQAIRLLIMKHQKFREKLAKKKRYYEGEHKILDEAERKNKLVCNHAKDIADTASSYFIGNRRISMEYLRMSGKGGINAGERRYGREACDIC